MPVVKRGPVGGAIAQDVGAFCGCEPLWVRVLTTCGVVGIAAYASIDPRAFYPIPTARISLPARSITMHGRVFLSTPRHPFPENSPLDLYLTGLRCTGQGNAGSISSAT
jgi:hypothetical protein